MAIHSPALDPSQPTGLLLDGMFEGRDTELTVENPYTGDTIATVAVGNEEDVAHAVAEALEHLPPAPAADRAAILDRAARLVSERAETFARTICVEAGKPITQARVETQRAWTRSPSRRWRRARSPARWCRWTPARPAPASSA